MNADNRYVRFDWAVDLVKAEDEYNKYLFLDYDYVKAPIYLWTKSFEINMGRKVFTGFPLFYVLFTFYVNVCKKKSSHILAVLIFLCTFAGRISIFFVKF